MKLADFRAQLESEAKTRCEQQEIIIKELHAEIARLKNQILVMKENQVKDDLKRTGASMKEWPEYMNREFGI